MAHQMTNTDAFVGYKQPAWHGLGEVIDEQMPPHDALEYAGLDWTVDQVPLYDAEGNVVPSHVLNRRSDNNGHLGVVKRTWVPVNNSVLADFAEALSEQDKRVWIETVGSIKSGRVVYVLARAEAYAIGSDDDGVVPYLLLSVGHDGTMALRGMFTTIRVVCANTLFWALGEAGAQFTIPHTTNVMDYIDSAKSAIGIFDSAAESQREASVVLAGRDVSRDDLQSFWMDVYTRDFGAVPVTPINKREQTKREKAQDAMLTIANRFDRERDIAGANAWNAVNAYTGYLQNDREYRSGAEQAKLFGRAASRSTDAFKVAMATFA